MHDGLYYCDSEEFGNRIRFTTYMICLRTLLDNNTAYGLLQNKT